MSNFCHSPENEHEREEIDLGKKAEVRGRKPSKWRVFVFETQLPGRGKE